MFVLIRGVGHARVRRGRAMTGTKCTKKRDARAKPPKAMFTLVLYWIALVPKQKSIRYYSVNTYISDMWLSSWEMGVAQPRSPTEIVPISPFLCVNRSLIRYGFRADAKAFRYNVNIT